MQKSTSWRPESTATVVGDDGKSYRVITEREFTTHRYLDGTWSAPEPNRRRFRLSTGAALRPLEGDLLQIPSTGVTLPMPPPRP